MQKTWTLQEDGQMLQKSHTNKQNPMAKEVRQSKYRQQVIPDKKKPKPVRKEKHKGDKDVRQCQ